MYITLDCNLIYVIFNKQWIDCSVNHIMEFYVNLTMQGLETLTFFPTRDIVI